MLPARTWRKAERPTICSSTCSAHMTIEKEERAENQAGDDDGENCDSDEAPEMDQALLEQSAEASGSAGLVAEESPGDEEEVDEEIKEDGGVAEAGPGVSDGAFVDVDVGFAEGAEVEAA